MFVVNGERLRLQTERGDEGGKIGRCDLKREEPRAAVVERWSGLDAQVGEGGRRRIEHDPTKPRDRAVDEPAVRRETDPEQQAGDDQGARLSEHAGNAVKHRRDHHADQREAEESESRVDRQRLDEVG